MENTLASFVNGVSSRFISADNRGLAYGDGIFETILLRNGELIFLEEHLRRLQQSAIALGIAVDSSALRTDIQKIIPAKKSCGVVKIILSRAALVPGYGGSQGASGDRVVLLQAARAEDRVAWEQGVDVGVCEMRLARQPRLAGHKHLNRLEQVLAATELQENTWREGLMLDTDGVLVEGTRSNVFVVKHGQLITPSLDYAGVRGVMRDKIIAACVALDISVSNYALNVEELAESEEIFICNSVFGIWPVRSLAGNAYSPGKYCRKLQQHFTAEFYD